MKKLTVLAVCMVSITMMLGQVASPPAPPEPPAAPVAPSGPSVNIDDEKVTIVDKKGNVYVIDDYGIRKNGMMITGDNDDLNDEIEDLMDDFEEITKEIGYLSPSSDDYERLMDDLADLEEELAELTDYDYAYKYASPDTLPDSTTVTIGTWRITVKEDNEGGEDYSFDRIDDEDMDDVDDHYVDPFETKWFLFDLGYNTYLNADYKTDVPEAYNALEDQQTWGSWDVNLHLFRQRLNMAKGYLNLNWGLSFEWHNYRYNSDFKMLPKMDSVTLVFESTEGIPYDFKKNRFSTTHFTIPVILGFETKPWDTDHSFRMGFGYSPGLLWKGKTKIVEGGDTQKVKDDFNLEQFRHELNYMIGFGGLNLYASYDLNGMFVEGQGPELHPFSIGLIINRGF